jgi:hypothetical protein
VPFVGTRDGKLDITRRLEAGRHRLLVVLCTLYHRLHIRIFSFKGHPFWGLLFWSKAGFIHSLNQDFNEAGLIKLRNVSILILKFLLQFFNQISNITNNVEYFRKIDYILISVGGNLNFWVNFGLDVGSSLKLGIDNQILNGYCIDRRGFFGVAILISAHHVIKYRVHILPQQVLIIVLQVKRLLIR